MSNYSADNENNKILSIFEAAKFLKVSEKTLRRWEFNGKLSPIRTQGGHRRYSLSQLVLYKNSKKLKVKPISTFKANLLEVISVQKYKNNENNLLFREIYTNLPVINKKIIFSFFAVMFFLLSISLVNVKTNFVAGLKTYANNKISNLNINSKSSSDVPQLNKKEELTQVLAATSFNNISFNVNTESNFREDANFDKTINANGGTITSTAQTFNLIDTSPTLNIGGAATNVTIGADTGTTTIKNSLTVEGTDNDIAGTLNLSGNTLTSTDDLLINPTGGGVKIGTGTQNSVDLSGSDLYVTGDLEVDGIAYIPTLSINSDNFTDLTGTGLQISSGSLQTTLGTAIESSEIADDTIKEVDLNASNSATNGFLLSYNSSTGGFTWTTSSFTDTRGIDTVQESDVTINSATATTVDFLGGDFDLSESPAGELNVQLASILTTPTGVSGGWDVSTTLTSGTADAFAVSASGTITIPVTEDITFGTIGLNDVGVSNVTSGASRVGAFDEFANSSSTNIQDVLDDLDAAIGAGSSKWAQASGFIYVANDTDDVVLGGTTVANGTFYFDESAANLYLGTNETLNGVLTIYSSGVAITDPTITTDASGNLIITSANFNTTATGINATAIGATTPSTAAFSTLSSTGTTTLASGAGAVTTIGNTTGSINLNGTTLGLTANGTGNDITLNLVDDNTDALDIQQSTNNYININTTNSSEEITFGNAITNPVFTFAGGGNLLVTGADILGPSGENIDLGEASADIITFYVGGSAELGLSSTAIYPTTDSGLDVGSASSQFADLYLDGGNINLDNSTDIDIDDALATSFSISEGSNEYLNISTDATEAVTLDLPVTGGTSTTGNLFTSNIAKTINLGTGTLADTINIGNGGSTADTINIGNAAVASTITIGNSSATGVSITDDNWSITSAGTATFPLANLTNSSNQLVFDSDGAAPGTLTWTPTTSGKTIILPDANGTVAVSVSAPITLSVAGNIACPTCLTSSTTLFTLVATSGSNSTITSGDNVTLTAGSGITTTGDGADTVTIASTLGTSIESSEITDNTITTADLNAVLTFADGDFLDLGLILHDDSALQGLRLPNTGASPASPSSGEGFIAYDATNNVIKYYDGGSWVTVSSGSGASKWTESLGVLYPNTITDDLAIGGTTITAAAFGVDESANTIYLGDGVGAGSTTLTFKSDAGADTGNLLYNTDDQFQFSGGDVVIDQDLTVTGGDLLGSSGENIDLGEATAVTTTFYIGGTGELTLAAAALAPFANGGLDLGTASNKFGDLYLTGGDIVLDNATDIDIDNDLATSFSISESTNNFIAIKTTVTDNLSFGNASTNPTYNFLGTGAVTIAGSADNTDALILTAGDVLVTDGDLDLSGGDFNVTLDAADGASITSNATSTADAFTITSTGVGSDALQINFTQSDDLDATDTTSGLVITGTSSSGDADTYYGLNISGITAGAATETALNIGAGWDTGINLNANTLVNIGDAGTDFTSGGGLTLAGHVTLSSDVNEGLSGGGLIDCEGASNKLTWDSATNKFQCEADQGAGSGTSKWTEAGGLLYPNNFSTVDLSIGASSLTAPFSVDVSDNIVRIGDGVSDAFDPTITFYASDATNSGSLSYTDSDQFSFTGGNIIFGGNLSSTSATALIDFSSVTHGSAAAQGLKLPQNTALTNMGTNEGFLAYDNDDNVLQFYDGSSWVTVSSGTGSSKWSDGGAITYLTQTGDDLVVGSDSTDLVAPFSIDVSANTVRIGDATVAGNATLSLFASNGATGNLLYNTSDQFQFSGGDVVIDQDLTLTGGDLLGPSGENIDLGEATAVTTTFYIGGTGELTLAAAALAPFANGGLDLGTASNKFGDLYLTGGDIVLDNATDIDIDNDLATSFSISESTNNFIAIKTTVTDNLSFGNASTNPTYNFLGTGAVTIAGSAEGTTALGITAGDLVVTDGDLTLSGGEIAATAGNATGTNFLFTTGALTTGTGLGVSTASNVITSGGLFSGSLTSSSATASFTGDVGTLSSSRTNSTGAQTLTDSADILDLSRTTITNNGTATTNVNGPILNITNTATQTLGTLNDSAPLIRATQDADATGALLHLVSNRSSSSPSILVEQTLGGTDALLLTDAGNMTLNGTLSLAPSSNQLVFDSDGAAPGTLTWTPTTSGKTIILPDANGTVAVSASGPITLSVAGNIACPTCLTGTTNLFTLSDGTNTQLVTSGDTVSVLAGTGITTTVSLTDTITIASTLGTSIESSEITDNTITTTDLNAVLTFADGDFLDLGLILHDDSALQGLRLPNTGASPASPSSGEGFIAYDATNNVIKYYDGGSWVTVSSGSGASKWTESLGVLYPNTITDDLAIGGTTITAAAFGVDESANTIYLGDGVGAGSTTLTFKSDAGADTGNLLYNTNDSFQFSDGDVVIDQDLTLTGGTITGPNSASIDIGAASLGSITFTAGGNGDFLFGIDAGTNMQITASAAPGVDMVAITNSGFGTTTDNIDALAASIFTATGAGANNSAIHATIGNAPVDASDVINGIEVTGVAQTSASTTQNLLFLDAASSGNTAGTLNAINIDSITGSTATETAINIGTGWDNAFNAGGTNVTTAELTYLASGINLSTGSSEVTGTLPVGSGGTGATTLTLNGVLYGNGTSAVGATTAGTNGQLLLGVTSGAPVFATMSADATITNAGVLTIAADAVALSTDTTGVYVGDVTAGSGISVSGTPAENYTETIALGSLTANWSQTGAFDIVLNNASSELSLLESTGATFFGTIDVGDLTADRTYTFPDATGAVCLSTGNCTGLGGEITGSGAAGQVAFFTDADSVTSENMFEYDSTNDVLSLGTGAVAADTSALLDLYGESEYAVLRPADVTTEADTNNSPILRLRGTYDSDVAVGPVTSSNFNFDIRNVLTAAGASPASRLDFLNNGGAQMLTISSAGVITVPDAGLLDLSNILHNDSAAQGFKLPQSTALTDISGQEGYVAYDTDDNLIKVLVDGVWTNVSGASTTLKQAYDNDADGSDAIILTTSTDGDIIFQTIGGAADTQFEVVAASAPEIDMVNFTNTGFGTTTNNVDTFASSIFTATGAGVNNSAIHAIIGNAPVDASDIINGVEITGFAQTVASTTQNLLFIDAAASGNTAGSLNGINIDSITADAATETAVNIGSGWDTDIAFADSSVILDGPSSSTLMFQDFVTITASSLTDFDCTDCIDFDDLADSMTLDASTSFVFPAAINLTLDASSTANTTTTGVLDINVGAGNAAVVGVDITLTQNDGATAATDATAQKISLTGNDADGDVFGLVLSASATVNATTGTYEAAISIDNAENTAASMTDAILITSSGVADGITDAIDVSAANINNALNLGANFALFDGIRMFEGATGTLTFEDTSGNDLVTLVDNTNAGDLTVTGTYTGDSISLSSGTATPVSMTRSASGQWLGMNDGTDAFGYYNNAGTPEAAVAANIGSIAVDTTNGALYIKTTDTVNTGWSQLATTAGNYTGWNLDGDDVSPVELISSGETAVFTGGAGITTDITAANTLTIDFASSELNDLTWGTGANATIAWTTSLSGSNDPVMTFGDNSLSLTNVTDFDCTDCIDFDDIADSPTLDAATDINLSTFALSIDLDSTGDFSIRDVTTDIATFADSGAITFDPTDGTAFLTNLGAGSNVQVAATAAPTVDLVSVTNAGQATTTTGVDGISLTFVTGDGTDPTNNGINLALTSGGTAATDVLNGINFGLTGTSGTERGINFSDNNFDTDINATTDLTIGIGGTNEVSLTDTNFAPTSSGGNSLGSASAEWAQLFLGDDAGINFGLQDDWTMLYDEATDDRLELTTAGTSGMLISSATVSGTGLLATFDSMQNGTGISLSIDAITSGTGLLVENAANTLTTGTLIQAQSTATSLTTAGDAFLGYFNWEPGSSTTASGDLFRINIGTNGNVTNLFNVTDNGSSLFRVSETQIESAVPHLFSATGDVSFSYDANFTNQTSSQIESLGPFSVVVGESFESNDLTLTTYNAGDIVLNPSGSSSGYVVISDADPTIIYDTATATDTDFWTGVVEDAGGDDDDSFQIGDGTTPGTNAFLTISTLGAFTLNAPAASTTALTITDTDYTNALSIDDNNIIGTTATINFTNFDVASTGNITISSGTTLPISLTRSASGQWLGMNDGTDAFGYYNNAGTPEGAVAANIGSVAVDTTNGALYVKTTDTVNTGWSQLATTAGNYTGWNLDGDDATPAEAISSGNTALIAGGTNGIDTDITGTDTLTIDLDYTEITTATFGTGSGWTWTFDAGTTDPTLAFADNQLTIGGAATLTATAVTDFDCTDCIDFDDISDSPTLDAATDINLSTFALSIDLDSTGDFSIRDVTTDIATFADSGAITFDPTDGTAFLTNLGAGSNVQVAATAAPTVDIFSITNAGQATVTNGVDGISLTFVTGNGADPTNNGINLALTSGGTAATDVLNGINFGLTGTSGTERGINFADNNFDTDINATTDLTMGIGGANEVSLTATNFAPVAAEGNSLGSSTLEWEQLFLGDNAGANFGLDDDWTILYDETTDDRLELTAAGATGFLVSTTTGTQTYASQVATTATTSSAWVFTDNSLTTGTGGYVNSSSITQGNLFQIATATGADTLTSGNLLKVSSDLANSTFTGNLVNIDWSPDGSTEIYNSTADLLHINAGQYANPGYLLDITDNGSAIFSVSQTKITSALPHEFTASGDVSIAYDLIFTNQTASTIDSYGPLTVRSGESFENNDLTLATYGTGNVLLDPAAAGYIQLEGATRLNTQATLANDATPDVSAGSWFVTGGTTTITDFDAGTGTLEDGHLIVIESAHAVTIDCSSSTEFYCGTADIVLADNDLISFIYDATEDIWRLVGWVDESTDGGQDIAEYFPSTQTLSAGEVVKVDPENAQHVLKTNAAYENKVLGIVSTNPGQVLGEPSPNSYPIALAGRVPVKISNSSSEIIPGDYLTASPETGLAMKAQANGKVIGQALEGWTPNSGKDSVTVFINNTYIQIAEVNPSGNINLSGNINDGFFATYADSNQNIDVKAGFAEVTTAKLKAGIAEVASLFAPNIKTNTITTDTGNIKVKLGTQELLEGKFEIVDQTEGVLVSVDNLGNTEIKGDLTAENINVQNANITNNLHVGKIYADEIVANQAKFDDLRTNTQTGVTREEIEQLLAGANASQNLMNQSATWSVNLASGSANLKDLALENLFVTGSAAIDSLSVSKSIGVGTDLIVQQILDGQNNLVASSFDTLSAPLSIQSAGLQPVSIMAGKILIDTNGNVQIDGNLAVTGTITTSGINLKENENGKVLSLVDSQNFEQGYLSASGSAKLKDISTDQIKITADQSATSSSTLQGNAYETSATAGKAKIAEGTSDVIIRNPKVKSDSLVFITPLTSTGNYTLYVKSQTDGEFSVGFNNITETEVSFNWWIVDVVASTR